MSDDRKDKEMICGLTADERNLLQRELRALPEMMPPRAIWQRIREQAEAEGLIGSGRLGRLRSWTGGGLAAAAAVALVAVIVPFVTKTPGNGPAVTVPVPDSGQQRLLSSSLQTLMVQSRQLESDLRALPAAPRVVRAGTAATISDLEDRIAAIDFQLNDPDVTMTPGEEEIFWRERVRLMNLLFRLRYAQAQGSAF